METTFMRFYLIPAATKSYKPHRQLSRRLRNPHLKMAGTQAQTAKTYSSPEGSLLTKKVAKPSEKLAMIGVLKSNPAGDAR